MPVDIHGKQYATVNERIQELHGSYKGSSSIITEVVTSGEGIVRVKATLTLIEQAEGMESHSNTFTGHAEEIIGSTMINKTSALENAETSAVGRALAFAGFSTDASIASADEVANAIVNQNALNRTVGNHAPAKTQASFTTGDLQKEVADNWQDYRGDSIDFGKHKGESWKDLPIGYVSWLSGTKSDKNPKNNQMAMMELEYREKNDSGEKQVKESNPPPIEDDDIIVTDAKDLKSIIAENTEEMFG
jgi:hypothetical protein